MSTSAVSSSSIYQELQTYFQQRQSDLQQLGQDLTSGNLANAQQDYAALQSLGQSGPFTSGDVFASTGREQDFTAVGQALQSGNLSAAQQAFSQLESTFQSQSSGSTSGTSPANSIYDQLQTYRQDRQADLQQLSKDLAAGNLTAAQQDYQTLVALGQNGPSKNGNVFGNSQREQDFSAIGQALQSGDLTGAQQALAQLEATFGQGSSSTSSTDSTSTGATSSTGSSTSTSTPTTTSSTPATSTITGPEIVLNLANAPAGEQITISLGAPQNGSEQVSISATNPQSQTPEQITLNLNPNSNQQIVLDLFNSTSSNSTQGSSLNTTA